MKNGYLINLFASHPVPFSVEMAENCRVFFVFADNKNNKIRGYGRKTELRSNKPGPTVPQPETVFTFLPMNGFRSRGEYASAERKVENYSTDVLVNETYILRKSKDDTGMSRWMT